jgi:hypothetical protein
MGEGDRDHGVAVEVSAGSVNHLQDRRKGWVGGWVGLSEPSVIGRSGRWRNGEDMDAAVAGPVEETPPPVIVALPLLPWVIRAGPVVAGTSRRR